MSYYFCIVNTRDQPTFETEFGTSKQGGDGIARFSQEARNLNPFLMHASLDYADELQWHTNQMYVIPTPNIGIHTTSSTPKTQKTNEPKSPPGT
ncbi:MAG: hypothetical protein L6R41_003888 [Letrouitia leprolyta]|nr:MAG: hypothetical protein L6R41_003888 [Letrouitia leprolyta]